MSRWQEERDRERNLARRKEAREVLRLIARGWTSARIAEELGTTQPAVEHRTLKALRVLGARNSVHAVVIAGLEGVLTREDLRAAAAVRRDGWVNDRQEA